MSRPQTHCERAVLEVARPFANRHGTTVAANALRNAALELEGRDAPASEWYVSEHYRDEGTVYVGNDDLEIDLYLEKANGDGWNTGIFDRTIGCHPTIPATIDDHGSKARALSRLVELAANAAQYVDEFRSSDPYRRAKAVQERAPPTANKQGSLWDYEVRQREMSVFDGRQTVDEALAELEAAAP